MKAKLRLLSGTALAAFAGTMLFAASTFAQDQGASGAASTPGSPAQPSTSEPGQTAQPYGPSQQQNTAQPGAMGQQNQQMGSPQSSSKSATMSASAGEPLSKVKNAKTTLASASVQDSTGQAVGQVATVHTTKKGTPTTIDVTLQATGGGTQAKTVAIKASQLRYDQSSNTLKAELSSSDIQSLPSATSM